jgi:hypothetical protein
VVLAYMRAVLPETLMLRAEFRGRRKP